MLGGSLLGGSRFAGRYESGLYLLADEVKPPLDMAGHIGGIRGEQVHGKEQRGSPGRGAMGCTLFS